MAKRTEEAAKLAGLMARKTGAPMEGTESGELVAVNNALQRHKTSNDHDSFDHIWSGINEFLQNLKVAGLMPIGETADIGTALRMFRKLWVSELTTLIFRKGNVLVMDGTFVLTKQSGKFAADVAAGDTQIDFGQALTVGDYLLLRAENKMEYMQVGSLVDGTTYNVTRNLDGSGANDWPRESVYFVRGHEGDGWLELTAVDEQRISSFTQGANWDQWLEEIRLGIIDGWQASPFAGNGFAMGNYAANKYLVYTENDGFLINGSRAQFGNMVADENGLSLMRLRDAIRFYKDGKIIGKLLSNSAGEEDFIRLQFGEEDSDFFIDGKFSQDPSLWSGHSLMFDDNDYISAPRALKLHSGLFNNPSHYVESPFISVSANKVYQVSYWDKFISGGLSSNGLSVMIHCDCYDANNQPISSGGFTSSAGYYGYNPKSYDWRQTSHTFKTPANTAKIVITITCSYGDSNNYSQLLFDDFEIVELFGLSQIDIYKNKVEISSYNGLLVNGNVAATNISQSPIENGILQAGADKKISSGWLPDLSNLYLPINGKAADAEKLDGLDSTQFERASDWLSWTPTCTGWSSYTARRGRYRVQGKTLFFVCEIRGTSNATSATVTLPAGLRSANVISTGVWPFAGIGTDNGVSLANPIRGNVANNSTVINLYKDFGGANWTASGNKQAIFSGWCEIQ